MRRVLSALSVDQSQMSRARIGWVSWKNSARPSGAQDPGVRASPKTTVSARFSPATFKR